MVDRVDRNSRLLLCGERGRERLVCDAGGSEPDPFITFDRGQWSRLRADTPLTLTPADLDDLRGVIDRVTTEEVEMIHLPLSRLLNLRVAAAQALAQATTTFLGQESFSVPFVIGLAGSVAVGKSTIARILQSLLARWPDHPAVDLVATDGFLYPNRVLEERRLMHRKGFPESYDQRALLAFLARVKAGERGVASPRYSHHTYDILPDGAIVLDAPDIVIVEGLNVLQSSTPSDRRALQNFVSDYFDFSIYIDADITDLRGWYRERFLRLRSTAFRDPSSYFHRYSTLTDLEAERTADRIWREINEVNLRENILPTRERADLILEKGADHAVRRVRLRRS